MCQALFISAWPQGEIAALLTYTWVARPVHFLIILHLTELILACDKHNE